MVRWSLGAKIAKLITGAAAVTVGSEYLWAYARRFNENVHLLPTSIDLATYPSVSPMRAPGAPFTIGWIGSPGTSVFLREVEEPLAEIATRRQAKVIVVGAGSDFSLRIPGLQSVPWSERTEIENLCSFDVGIMPLTDTPFTRGKCAFKLIQYMGAWKPVVASPVGENIIVVRHGESGFLARNAREWLDALNCFADNAVLARQMGLVGRSRVESDYAVNKTASRLAVICDSLAGPAQSDARRRHNATTSL
jgi:glycosyltransferase involved in cell wall biosynthesis